MATKKKPARKPSRSDTIERVLKGLRRLAQRADGARSREPSQASDLSSLLCAPPTVATGPEHTVHIREALPVAELTTNLGDPVEGQSVLMFACAPLSSVLTELNIDLIYEQRWYLREQLLTSLSGVIPLAPLETVRFTVISTQRKQLTQTTLDETEDTRSAESTFVDRDVLNVTRSTSQTKNWTLSGNASFNTPKFSAGVDGSISETVNRASSSTAESTTEATQKASTNLRMLHKTEVQEVTETVDTRRTTRVLANPYHDRSGSPKSGVAEEGLSRSSRDRRWR